MYHKSDFRAILKINRALDKINIDKKFSIQHVIFFVNHKSTQNINFLNIIFVRFQ